MNGDPTEEALMMSLVGDMLGGLVHGDSARVSAALETTALTPHADMPGAALALASISAVHALNPDRATRLAERAAALDGTPAESALIAAAVAFAQAGGATVRVTSSPPPARPISHSALRAFVAYQHAEAALACGQITLAVQLVDAGAGRFSGNGVAAHSPTWVAARVVGGVMRARTLLFAGRVADATINLREVEPLVIGRGPELARIRALFLATKLLTAAGADCRTEVRELTQQLTSSARHAAPRDYIEAGTALLTAYGLQLDGSFARAASEVHWARSGGPLPLVDEVLSTEILASLALAEGDLEAAEAWQALLDPMASHPIAAPTVLRTRGRVLLMRGNAHDAYDAATEAASRASREGRIVEATEAKLIVGQARLAAHRGAEAVLSLTELTTARETTGFHAARRIAAKHLREAGLRLEPVPGSDWAGLSRRERDVAVLVAAGLTNAEIAADLHLSVRTVRAHVSRILTAFGAASRFIVAASLASHLPPPSNLPPPLTTAQTRVAKRVATGLGNEEIARQLGLSIKTVEKHLGDIYRRWGVHTRVGVARGVRALEPEHPG